MGHDDTDFVSIKARELSSYPMLVDERDWTIRIFNAAVKSTRMVENYRRKCLTEIKFYVRKHDVAFITYVFVFRSNGFCVNLFKRLLYKRSNRRSSVYSDETRSTSLDIVVMFLSLLY